MKYKNGNIETVNVEHALGTTENPVSSDFLVKKFFANVDGKSLRSRPDALVEAIWNLEELPDIANLMSLIKGA